MSIFRFFAKRQSAPLARERLQVLLAHERVALSSDLVGILREEILAVIAKHVQVDNDCVKVKIERDERVSLLEIDVEIPLDAARKRLGITPATIYESIPVEACDDAVPARM